jgi:hypothetical protein
VPRGDYKIEGTPYGIWVETVEQQNRIRLPKDIQDMVPWLQTEDTTIECTGMPGPVGGLQVQPFAADDDLRKAFVNTVGSVPVTSAESGQPWTEAARLLASSWRIRVSVESSRVNIPLAEPIRQLLALPSAGGIVVVFGFGEIIEVWDASAWREHVRRLAKEKVSILSEAIEALGHR